MQTNVPIATKELVGKFIVKRTLSNNWGLFMCQGKKKFVLHLEKCSLPSKPEQLCSYCQGHPKVEEVICYEWIPVFVNASFEIVLSATLFTFRVPYTTF